MKGELEDKTFGGDKPYIDLTPFAEWNLEKVIVQHVGKNKWLKIKEHVQARVNFSCELCGASSDNIGEMGKKAHKHKIDFRFLHDEESGIATLIRIINVCVPCYQAIHIRQTEIQSKKMSISRSPLVGAIARLSYFYGFSDYQIQEWKLREEKIWLKNECSDEKH